jgi:hypothetical protein
MSWFLRKPNPQARLEKELLRQWRRGRRQTNLSLLPLDLILRVQSLRMAATAAAEPEKTDCLPAQKKLRQRIGEKIWSGSAWLVKRLLKWLSRRRSLHWLRPALIQGRRRLLVSLLAFLLRCLRLAVCLCRLFRGFRKR